LKGVPISYYDAKILDENKTRIVTDWREQGLVLNVRVNMIVFYPVEKMLMKGTITTVRK
jgi:DNA-directed RNA polymerase subunit E'/Rpb7